MELANIKIKHEIAINKIIKEKEKFINDCVAEKLILEKKELQQKLKLAKFRAQKEM
ncbi:hypothetical protein PUN28_017793 [Cardiocondyla obscurior]|uniref:Uncharacterized protein n=1 Tax=Cardiocondyla obscurior TaxID=286306 RepID=A0AAW2ENF1_9HYME